MEVWVKHGYGKDKLKTPPKKKRHGSARKRNSNAANERTCCERPEMQLMRGGAGSIMSNAKAHIFICLFTAWLSDVYLLLLLLLLLLLFF